MNLANKVFIVFSSDLLHSAFVIPHYIRDKMRRGVFEDNITFSFNFRKFCNPSIKLRNNTRQNLLVIFIFWASFEACCGEFLAVFDRTLWDIFIFWASFKAYCGEFLAVFDRTLWDSFIFWASFEACCGEFLATTIGKRGFGGRVMNREDLVGGKIWQKIKI